MSATACPEGWNAEAHGRWLEGRRQAAIDAVLAVLNAQGIDQDVSPLLQLGYYIFFCGDPAGAAGFLEQGRARHPRHPQLLLNLAVCLRRSGQPAAAVARLGELLAIEPDNPVAHDLLCSAQHELGRDTEAAAAGTRALELKDRANRAPPAGWQLPRSTPADWANRPGRRAVIAFSLWGGEPCYLRGALDNALAAPQLYPGWRLRYYVDDSVPAEICAALAGLGAEIVVEAPGQTIRRRLGWRFQVANDPAVGRFLVRDVDSVIDAREKAAVDEWLASDCWFHAMRDWWTHTDLLLAGMWGGVAGVLPALLPLLESYRAPAVETPNIDQWFLRDRVWRLVRGSCLVHDRYFTPAGARPWPEAPPPGNRHVGQDVFATRRLEQEARLGDWLARLPSLGPPSGAAG